MDIPPAIIYINSLIDQGRRHAKKGLYTFAFEKYAEAKGLIGYIEYQWKEGAVKLTHEDEFALETIRERLIVALSSLTNGGTGLQGSKKFTKSEFRDAVEYAINELNALFQ